MPKNNCFNSNSSFFAILVCIAGALFYCYEFILRIIPGALQAELIELFGHISATAFGQISALYYFAYSPMQLPVGMLMDRYGARRLLTFACLCCVIGSWLFSFTSSIVIAGCGRFLIGFGSSFAFVGVLSLAIQWLPRRFFSLAAGLITTLGMLGLVYGEVKITQLTLSLGCDYVLSMLTVVGLFLTLITWLIVRDGPKGYVAPKPPWPIFFNDVWFVLTSSQVWLIGIIGACIYTSLSVFGELWGKSYLEHAYHLSKVEAAQTISLLFLGWAVGAPIAGSLSDRSGRRLMPVACGAVMSLICISIILYYPDLSYQSLNCLMFLYGLFSATEIIVFIMAKENSGAKLTGTVFAAVNMIVTLGCLLFQPLVGKLLDVFSAKRLYNNIYLYTAADYQLALSILPISLIIVIICLFFINTKPSAINN